MRKNPRGQVAEILPSEIGVGIRGAVAGRNIEHAIGTKGQVAAVMPVRFVFQDHVP